MQRFIIAIVLIFSILAANAGTIISGRVVDGNKKSGVGYATIALLRDSTVVSAVAARNDGNFSFETKEQGNLLLEVSSVGYTTIKRELKVSGKRVDVGSIAISEGVAVDAVAITIQKPIVTADAEK